MSITTPTPTAAPGPRTPHDPLPAREFPGPAWTDAWVASWTEDGDILWTDEDPAGGDACIRLGRTVTGGSLAVPVLVRGVPCNLAITGDAGSGKSTLATTLALSATASGRALVWYLDSSSYGIGSPELVAHADWATAGTTTDMLPALETLIGERAETMRTNRWRRFPVDAEHPLVIVIVDGTRELWNTKGVVHGYAARCDQVHRWQQVAWQARKTGIAFWSIADSLSVEAFGGPAMHELMVEGTVLAQRSCRGSLAGAVPWSRARLDLAALPVRPGYGYAVTDPVLTGSAPVPAVVCAATATATAPAIDATTPPTAQPADEPAAGPVLWRADDLGSTEDADRWFTQVKAQTGPVRLEDTTAALMPPTYPARSAEPAHGAGPDCTHDGSEA